MEADQKLLDLAGSLLQMISKTQENLGGDAQDTEKAE